MKLTAKIKLLPTEDQANTLRRTLETASAACNYISQVAWETRVFNRFKLHHEVYYFVKDQFNLTANIVVRAITKVASAYKRRHKAKRCAFKPLGAIAYDRKVLRYSTF